MATSTIIVMYIPELIVHKHSTIALDNNIILLWMIQHPVMLALHILTREFLTVLCAVIPYIIIKLELSTGFISIIMFTIIQFLRTKGKHSYTVLDC